MRLLASGPLESRSFPHEVSRSIVLLAQGTYSLRGSRTDHRILCVDDSVCSYVFAKIPLLCDRGGLSKVSRLSVLRAFDRQQPKSLLRESTRLSTTTIHHHGNYQEYHFRSEKGHLSRWRCQSDALPNSQLHVRNQQQEPACHPPQG